MHHSFLEKPQERKKKWIGSEKENKRKKLLLVPKKIKACALVFSIVFSCRE
jgi:hypothetical protein